MSWHTLSYSDINVRDILMVQMESSLIIRNAMIWYWLGCEWMWVNLPGYLRFQHASLFAFDAYPSLHLHLGSPQWSLTQSALPTHLALPHTSPTPANKYNKVKWIENCLVVEMNINTAALSFENSVCLRWSNIFSSY